MSALTARVSAPLRLGKSTSPWPLAVARLQSGRAKTEKPRLAYALVVIGGVFTIVVAQLLLSVGISQGAYQISALQSAQRELGWQKQSVAEDLKQISSPQYLAANAQALGMVINGTPAYLKLSTSTVVGVPAAASADGLQLGSPELVGNVLLGGVPLVTAPDLQLGVPVTPDTGASAEPEQPAPISLENGLPSPTTR